jgi:hypothetical protein
VLAGFALHGMALARLRITSLVLHCLKDMGEAGGKGGNNSKRTGRAGGSFSVYYTRDRRV